MNQLRTEDVLAQKADEVSLTELAVLLLEQKRRILRSALICGVLVATLVFLLPSHYKATTTFLPPSQNQSSASAALMSQLGSLGPLAAVGQGSLGLKNPLDLQTSLLKSETIRRAMVERFHLEAEFHVHRVSDAIKKLDNKTDILANAKDGLIQLSVTDRSPVHAADLANAYLDEYRKLTSSLALNEAAQRRLFFEQQLTTAKDKLAQSEEALKQTEQTSGLIQADSQARVLFQSAATLQSQITQKQIQVDSMRAYAGNGNVDLIQAQRELEGLRAALARLGNGKASSGESFDLTKGKLPEANLDYLRKSREVKYQETLFELLARQYEAAKLDEAKEGAIIQVVDPALPPDHRDPRYLALFTLAALVFGAAFSAIRIALQPALGKRDTLKSERLRRAISFWSPDVRQ